MALKHLYTIAKGAYLFMDNAFKLHGMPKNIVSYIEPTFTSSCWRKLFKLQWLNLSYSLACHSYSDKQIEAVNKCLEHFLKCFIGDKPQL